MARGCRKQGAHLLTRVRSNAVAYLQPVSVPWRKGRKPTYGSKVRLRETFKVQTVAIAQGLMTAIGIRPGILLAELLVLGAHDERLANPVGVGRAARPPKDVRGITRGCAQDAQLSEIHPR